jgi:hypothetical protein
LPIHHLVDYALHQPCRLAREDFAQILERHQLTFRESGHHIEHPGAQAGRKPVNLAFKRIAPLSKRLRCGGLFLDPGFFHSSIHAGHYRLVVLFGKGHRTRAVEAVFPGAVVRLERLPARPLAAGARDHEAVAALGKIVQLGVIGGHVAVVKGVPADQRAEAAVDAVAVLWREGSAAQDAAQEFGRRRRFGEDRRLDGVGKARISVCQFRNFAFSVYGRVWRGLPL